MKKYFLWCTVALLPFFGGAQVFVDGRAQVEDAELAGRVSRHEAGSNVHAIAAVTGLSAALDAKEGTGTVAAIDGRLSIVETGKLDVVTAASTYATTGTVGAIDVRVGGVESRTNVWNGITNEYVNIAGSNFTFRVDGSNVYHDAVAKEGVFQFDANWRYQMTATNFSLQFNHAGVWSNVNVSIP